MGKIIGIDLGTTTSCVAVWIGDRVEVIPDHQTGSRIIPSYVSFTPEERYIGEDAKNMADGQHSKDHENRDVNFSPLPHGIQRN